MSVPTITELYISVQTDLRNKLNITSIVGKMVLNAFAAVQAAKLKLYYLTTAKVQKNVFPDLAEPEAIGGTLERFGFVKLGRLPNPATAGEYKVQVTGTIGATIPAGTTFKSLDTSTSPDKLFILDSVFIFTASTEIIQIRALDIGVEAILEIGDELQLTSPLANVDSFQEVISVEILPIEAESIEQYRELVIQTYRLESQGGAKTDYREWSADAGGVRTVYPFLKDGEMGSVDLFIEANPADSTDGNGTPSALTIIEVEEVVEFDPDITKPLNERGRRPMTANVYFLPIVTNPVDVDIVNLSDSSLLTAISLAIKELLFDIRPFVDGLDPINQSNKGRLLEAEIYNIVVGITGVSATFDSLTMEVNSTPTSLYVFEDENIPYLDNLTTS